MAKYMSEIYATQPLGSGRAGTLLKAGGSILARLPGRLLDALLRWQERARQRHLLMAMDERMLKDIGLSRADATREASKPFWLP